MKEKFTKLTKMWFWRWGVGFSVVASSFIFSYQNCSPVNFSTNSSLGTNSPSSTSNPSSCVPTISVSPQLSFVPSSFDVGQPFQVVIANQNLYGSITLNFGDHTPDDVINPQSGALITHTYSTMGTFVITITATDSSCQTALNNTQNVAVSACIPSAVTLTTTLTPTVPVPPPVGSFTTQADITNSEEFTTSNWLVNGAVQPGGSDVNISFPAGSYTLQAEGTDSCGGQRPGPPIPICIATSGNPVTTVIPSTFVAGTQNTFSVANAGNYSSITINFGDGNTGTIPTSTGTITHAYQNSGNYTYVVTAVDSCGASRTTSTPVTVSPAACVPAQPDGCSDNEYCTGRTSCNPTGNCAVSCGNCGFSGTPVNPSTSCSGQQQCVAGGTRCNPTNTCTNVCGQCSYQGTSVVPVTTCKNNQVCVTGGTTCNPTQSCVTKPGSCGDPLPTPIPSPSPVPPPKPTATPIQVPTAAPTPKSTPITPPAPTAPPTSPPPGSTPTCTQIKGCADYAKSLGYTSGGCPQGTQGGFDSQKCMAYPISGDAGGPVMGCSSGCCFYGGPGHKSTTNYCAYNPNACFPDGIIQGSWHVSTAGWCKSNYDDRMGTCCSGKNHTITAVVLGCPVNYQICGP